MVIGHVLESWILHSGIARTIYNAIYMFHMPAFIVLTGSFSGRGDVLSKALRFAALYVLAQTVFALWYSYIEGGGAAPVTYPVFALWFLLAMPFWLLLTPLMLRFGIFAVPLSIVLALLAGYVPQVGHNLSLSRCFVFLPFFVLGAQIGPEHLARLRMLPLAVAVIGLIGLLALSWMTIPENFASALFLHKHSYTDLGLGGVYGPVWRTWALVLGFLAGAFIFAQVPDRQLPPFVERIGKNTLPIYIFHTVIIGTLQRTKLLSQSPDSAAVIFGFSVTLLCLWGFSHPTFVHATRFLWAPPAR